MKRLDWVLGWVLTLGACGPEFDVQHFTIERGETLHCVTRGEAQEDCATLSPVQYRLPVVLESNAEQVTLYVVDPETSDERVFVGVPQQDGLFLHRQWQRQDQNQDCTYQRTEDLVISRHDTMFTATERAVTDETAGCNALNVHVLSRVEWFWRGE